MFRAAVAALGSTTDADDLAQEAFVVAYRKLASFRGDAAFRTWLLAITWRKALDRRKSVGRWLRLTVTPNDSDADAANWIEQMPADQRTQEEDVAAAQLQRTLKRLIKTLPRKLRDALLLSGLGEYNYSPDRSHARHPGRHGEMAGFGSAARSEGKNGSPGTRL